MANALQRYAGEEMDVWRRCKRAAILYDWIAGLSVEEIERIYTTNAWQGGVSYGDITRIAEGTRFHLRSAHQILSALWPDQPQFLAALDEVLRQIESGLPAASLPLLRLPVPLTRGQYLSLHHAGVSSIEAVAAMDDARLHECVGPSAFQLIRPAKAA